MNGANDRLPRDSVFALKYHVESGDFNPGDQTDLEGLTDALVMVSMIYPKDGSLSTMLMSVDGRSGETKPLPDADVFKAWSMMVSTLSESKNLPSNLRMICKNTFEIIRAHILSSKDSHDPS